jgi:hypothetical protein
MAKVRKIILDVNGKEIKLSLKEAQQLKDLLNETFGTSKVTVYRDARPYWDYHDYSRPWPTTICKTGNVSISDNLSRNNIVWTSSMKDGTFTAALAA